jgi:hypothetical protein
VINALAKSDYPDKARQCLDIVRRMENPSLPGMLRIKPSVVTFSTVLNACTHTRGTKEDLSAAFNVARFCLKQVLSGRYGEVNNMIFGNFIFACFKLIKAGDARDHLIELAFQECCGRGLLDEKVYINTKRALSRERWNKLIHDKKSVMRDIKFSSLPEEWSKNVSINRRHGN